MIIEFTVGNYRSFKEKQTLSLIASDESRYPENVAEVAGMRLLKSAAIFGPNAGGKSNLIRAMGEMRTMVLQSSKYNIQDKLPVEPFLFASETKAEPSYFEMILSAGADIIRYGFQVTKSEVVSEWLHVTRAEDDVEVELFDRKRQVFRIDHDHFPEGNGLEVRTKMNSLFLTTVQQFGGTLATKMVYLISVNLFVHGMFIEHGQFPTVNYMGIGKNIKERVVNILQVFDASIVDIELENYGQNVASNPEDIVLDSYLDNVKVYFMHRFTNDNTESYHRLSIEDESDGTQKLFKIIGAILFTIDHGSTLIVDELEASFHPLITLAILGMYNSEDQNRKGAQIIFTTHDDNILDRAQLRKDQIYFVDKGPNNSSLLYSLAEFIIKVEPEGGYAKDYLGGRYGAIPQRLDSLFVTNQSVSAA